MTIGEQIRKYRKEAKMSQKELGVKLGISQQQIAQYENGNRIPKIDTINNIAGALEMGVRRLYPDFTMEEWKKSETYLQAREQNAIVDSVLHMLSKVCGDICTDKDRVGSSSYDLNYILSMNDKKYILLREDIDKLASHLHSLLPFILEAFNENNLQAQTIIELNESLASTER